MNKVKIDYRLYLVTDREVLQDRNLCECVEAAILGGATLVQLREKTVGTRNFYEIAKEIKLVLQQHKVPLIINDRLDIAMAVDADGLHIGQEDMPLELARKLLGTEKIIGVSVFNVEEALEAQENGADYLGVGAVFTTPSKTNAKFVSLAELQRIKAAVNIPVVAIGGINECNVQSVMQTGVDGVSVISAILGKDDCRRAAKKLSEIVSSSKPEYGSM